MFLSDDQLQALTGSPRASRQIKWLQDHGWPHEVNLLDKPVVLAAAADRILGVAIEPAKHEPEGPKLVFSRQ